MTPEEEKMMYREIADHCHGKTGIFGEYFNQGFHIGAKWFESTILPLREKANDPTSPDYKWGATMFKSTPPPDEEPWAPPPNSKPDYMSESYRATRFILIACDMWDAEHKEPMTSDNSKTWLEIMDAAVRVGRQLADSKIRKAIHPALFKRFWEDSGRTARIRPHYIPENWIAFIQWCKREGVLAE